MKEQNKNILLGSQRQNYAEILVNKQPGIVTEKYQMNLQDPPPLPSYKWIRVPNIIVSILVKLQC